MINMKNGEIIRHIDVGEKFYILYDETDTNHCILIGKFKTLKETKEVAKNYIKYECPEAVLQAYEMIRGE